MKFSLVVLELLQAYRRENEKRLLDSPSLQLSACKNYCRRCVDIYDRIVTWSGVKPVIRSGRKGHDSSVVYFIAKLDNCNARIQTMTCPPLNGGSGLAQFCALVLSLTPRLFLGLQ
jgi:hypothetical protein